MWKAGLAQLGFELCFVFSLFVLFVCCGGFGVFYSVGLNLITKLTMRVKIAKWRSLSYLAAFSKTHHNHVFSPWGRCSARATTSPGNAWLTWTWKWPADLQQKYLLDHLLDDNVIYPPIHICNKLVKKKKKRDAAVAEVLFRHRQGYKRGRTISLLPQIDRQWGRGRQLPTQPLLAGLVLILFTDMQPFFHWWGCVSVAGRP